MRRKVIGVLALQGAFAKHISMIESIGETAIEVRKPAELDRCDALILPGGESTAIFKQIEFIDLFVSIVEFAVKKPVFGTCAGLILMSKKIKGDNPVPFGLLDVEVERNAFGRQIESFAAPIQTYAPLNTKVPLTTFFIRAPRILTTGPDVKVLATYRNEPVIVVQGHLMGATCHPELTSSTLIHEYFLSLITLPI